MTVQTYCKGGNNVSKYGICDKAREGATLCDEETWYYTIYKWRGHHFRINKNGTISKADANDIQVDNEWFNL